MKFDSSLQFYMVFDLEVGQHLLFFGGNIGEFYTSKYVYRVIFSCSYRTIYSIQCGFESLFVVLVFHVIFQQLVSITGSVFSAFVTCSICIFGKRHLATSRPQTSAKGKLGQSHLRTVPVYFSGTLSRYLFAGEVSH